MGDCDSVWGGGIVIADVLETTNKIGAFGIDSGLVVVVAASAVVSRFFYSNRK